MKRLTKLFLSTIILSIALTACDLEAIVENINNTIKLPEAAVKVSDDLNVQSHIIEVFEQVNELAMTSNDGPRLKHHRKLPRPNWLSNTHLVLEYDEEPGVSGKIDVVFNIPPSLQAEDLSAHLIFDEFKADSTSIIGELDLELVSIEITPSFDLKTDGFLEIKQGSKEFLWYANYTIVWEKGLFTPQILNDNVYRISGFSRLKQDDIVDEFDIVNPLVYDDNCDYLLEGVIHLGNNVGTSDEFLVILDFGIGEEGTDQFGECDSYVEAMIGVDPLWFDLSKF